MSDISELLEYLHKHWESSGKFKEWATAVEQLQEENKALKEGRIRMQERVIAYERILDKGITVNNHFCPYWSDDCKKCPRGESEDKVCTCNDDKIARKCPVHEDKVEKPNYNDYLKHVCDCKHSLMEHNRAEILTPCNLCACDEFTEFNRGESENSEAGE